MSCFFGQTEQTRPALSLVSFSQGVFVLLGMLSLANIPDFEDVTALLSGFWYLQTELFKLWFYRCDH